MTTVKSAWLLPALALVMLPALAADKAPHRSPAARAPDPALLEFIGTWESRDGHWVDPMAFARIDPAKLQQGKGQHDPSLAPAAAKPKSKDPAGGDGV